MTQALSAALLVDEHNNRPGFSVSPTVHPLTPAEVNSGDFVVEDVSEDVGVKVGVTLANGQTVPFPIGTIVTIYR